MATLSQLASRLRSEIGDIPRSFVDTYTGDGVTTRFQLSQAPVLGSSLAINVLVPVVTSTVTAASASDGTITYTSSNTLTAGQTVNITGLTNSIPITAISGSGSVVTYSTTSTTSLSAGQTITISGATTTGFNGAKTILAVNAGTSFTVTSTVTGTTSTATGAIVSPFNLTGVTVATRSSTQFTVTNATTGTAVTGAAAVATGLATTLNVSSTTTIEEGIGIMTLAVAPANNSIITVSGTAYRYFTDDEISYYIDTAFCEHTKGANTSSGSLISLRTLPTIDEYPLVILATSMALYTLATDAAFDIDIISPDGVSIPRSERFRQLMEMMQVKKEQYRELCSLLGTGLYRIEVFNLRRISRMTNRYVPVYLPMEVDDRSLPQRAILPLPSYGSEPVPTDVATYDFNMYQGDSFQIELDFPFNVTGYTWKSAITQAFGGPKIQEFTITQSAADKLVLSLSTSQTSNLPERCYWDIQFTASGDPDYQKTYMRGKIFVTRQATT